MTILVCGGAGYIGSHFVAIASRLSQKVVILDNLTTGHREAVPKNSLFYLGDVRSRETLDLIFSDHKIDAVVHFCAKSIVGESAQSPLEYFDNNISGFVVLLESMKKYNINKLVFSSSAAVYGAADLFPIPEEMARNPSSPYGESKKTMENIAAWASRASNLRFVALRYFNAAGAAIDGTIGEDHRPETHLIPNVLKIPLGISQKLVVFGGDYPTQDGTCIRDYVHVEDIAEAHLTALQWLDSSESNLICNLGSGIGFSVLEIVSAAERIVGQKIPVEICERRVGDPAFLVADIKKADQIMGWKPTLGIEKIIGSAWNWHQKHPFGY